VLWLRDRTIGVEDTFVGRAPGPLSRTLLLQDSRMTQIQFICQCSPSDNIRGTKGHLSHTAGISINSFTRSN
jgi:hypothetical protein